MRTIILFGATVIAFGAIIVCGLAYLAWEAVCFVASLPVVP